jgi:DNA (cytosine-5)-methyltransferase 1
MNTKHFRLGELFCGSGGLGLGALGVQVASGGTTYRYAHAWATDNDEDACATYARNICGGNRSTVICADIRTLEMSKLGGIDGLAFGFPCNDFSQVGERRGFNGTFGPLYTYGVKALKKFAPIFFIAENVAGLANTHDGGALKQILKDLESAGKRYILTPHLYRFEEYGVPQMRHRFIIVGFRADTGFEFHVPAPTTQDRPLTCREAIEDPPIPADAPNQELTRQSAVVVERLKHTRPGENAWTADLPPHLRLNVKKARLSQIYRRMDPVRPAYTITGSGGGGTHGYHWKEHRALTNRERARLQTFPDTFVFEGSKERVRSQIGMAVPPKAAAVIASAILKTIAGVTYETVPADW